MRSDMTFIVMNIHVLSSSSGTDFPEGQQTSVLFSSTLLDLMKFYCFPFLHDASIDLDVFDTCPRKNILSYCHITFIQFQPLCDGFCVFDEILRITVTCKELSFPCPFTMS